MGNHTSSTYVNNETGRASVGTLTRPNNFTPVSTVEGMQSSIQNILDFHTKLRSVYEKIHFKIGSLKFQIGKDNVINELARSTYTQQPSLINTNKNTKKEESAAFIENKEFVKLLFNLGIFKIHIFNNDLFEVVEHMNFNVVHKQYTNNLNTLLKITPVKASFSTNTVDEDTIKQQFVKNLLTINNITARIIFYKYCIVFNNYLMHLYTIYAQSQFEIFKANANKSKKQNEFIVVQRELDDILKQTNPTYGVGLEKALNKLNDATNKVSGGANTNATTKIVSGVQNVKSLLKSSFDEFVASNESTGKFFNIVNEIIEAKIKKTQQQLLSTQNNTVINENIFTALKDLEKKIHNNSITPNNDNIDNMINQVTDDNEEKAILKNHLTMVSIKANATKFNQGLGNINSPSPPPNVVTTTNQNAQNANTISNPQKAKTISNPQNAKTISNPQNAKTISNAQKAKTISNPQNVVTISNTISNPQNANTISNPQNVVTKPPSGGSSNIVKRTTIG
uniref:Uncharacterized protein n=1 Tax=Pyramimonas orientalis virus TaxID=455367 RepID=A0A7M3UNN6_POV01|nr:hypothetical protein HWQ62_00170 [Pyramimonas orientalis virus]